MSRDVSTKIGSMTEYCETQNVVGRTETCSEDIYANLKEGGELSEKEHNNFPPTIYFFPFSIAVDISSTI